MIRPLSLPILASLALACGPVRRATLAAPANTPAVVDCTDGAYRCHDEQPQVCHHTDGEGRWWPTLARHPSGAPRRCQTGCVLDDAGVAGCAAVDMTDGGAL